MTQTRCPACSTVFRVTSEQLRAKAGTVRCGHCQAVFNAFEQLLDENRELAAAPVAAAPIADSPEPASPDAFAPAAAPAPPAVADQALAAGFDASEPAPLDPIAREIEEIAQDLALTAAEVPPSQALPLASVDDDTTHAARQAGLVAARELSETPAYDR